MDIQKVRVIFRRLTGGRVADVAIPGGPIRIDLLTDENHARSFLHEQIHLNHPDWSENRVIREEERLWNNMGQYERYRLYRRLFNRPFYGKDDDDENTILT